MWHPSKQSKVRIGGYDNSLMADPSKIVWFSLSLTSYWVLDLNGLDYGSDSVYESDTAYAIIDTGTSYMYVQT